MSAPENPRDSILRPAEGFSHVGEKFILGWGQDFYAIYDKNERRLTPSEPVAVFPRTEAGWADAWRLFSAWEPNAHAVSLTRSQRRSTATGSSLSEVLEVKRESAQPLGPDPGDGHEHEIPSGFAVPAPPPLPSTLAPANVRPIKTRRSARVAAIGRRVSSSLAHVLPLRTTASRELRGGLPPIKPRPTTAHGKKVARHGGVAPHETGATAQIIAHPAAGKLGAARPIGQLERLVKGLRSLFVEGNRLRVSALAGAGALALLAGIAAALLVVPMSAQSHEAFLAQAKPICMQLGTQMKAAASGWSPGNVTSMAAVLRKDVGYEIAAFAKLESLQRAPEDQAALSRFFAAATTAIEEQENLASYLERGDIAGASIASASLARTTQSYYQLADGLGLSGCKIAELP